MEATMEEVARDVPYPARVLITPALENRNRLTTAFRFLLAIPHLILVGGPAAPFLTLSSGSEHGFHWGAADCWGR